MNLKTRVLVNRLISSMALILDWLPLVSLAGKLRLSILQTYKVSVYRVKAVEPERALSAGRSEILEAPVSMKLEELLAR